MGKKSLVVCESPAKINKIQSFLGSGYIVCASYGHFMDLKKKEISIDFKNNYEPSYIISEGKERVVKNLKDLLKKCEVVYLASDYDREGEAIAWHISQTLKLTKKNTKRIIFTEITKSAILKAIENPTTIDLNMFYAQQARRVLDRIIGYLLSPILWKQIQNNYKQKTSLSAGRVQSVVVKIIIEREDEIKKFESEPYFKITGSFQKDNIILDGELNSEKSFKKEEKVRKFLKKCQKGQFFIQDVKTKESKRKPPMPFITSSLQQEASNKLGMSPKDTMAIAQKLYENGHITYMRTDSLVLSDEIHTKIEEFVTEKFSKDHYSKNKHKSKDKNSQEAHEACRPTDISLSTLMENDNITYRENRLYKLIWNRTIMSQMKPTIVDITNIKIGFKNEEKVNKYHFVSKKEFIKFKGFLEVYDYQNKIIEEYNADDANNNDSNDDSNDNDDTNNNETNDANDTISKEEEIVENTLEDLKKLKKEEPIDYTNIKAVEKFSKPPHARYTEASIIKKLDELGIGRPSTYATMIANVQDRKYVEKKTVPGKEKECLELDIFCKKGEIYEKKSKIKLGGEKDKLFPTELGEIVNRFLIENFKTILEYDFTAYVEDELDKVAKGKNKWHKIVDETYQKIKPKLESLDINPEKEKDKYRRTIGIDPDSEFEVVTYIGKYGPLVQLKDPNNISSKYAPLKDIKMEEVTLEQALELLQYPKKLGPYKGKDITLNNGKYGLYIKYNSKNYSIEFTDDLKEKDIDFKFAKKLIKDTDEGKTRDADGNEKERIFVEYNKEKIEILTGRYGPYFKYKGKNYSIYKSYDVNNLNEKDIQKIIDYKNKSSKSTKNKK